MKFRQPLLISLAALAPVCAHAQSSVVLYGTAHGQFESIKATDSVTATGAASPLTDKPARTRLSNVSSELGVKGTLDLGNGIQGLAQYTTGVNVDNANGGTSSGIWASAKDVFVGVGFKDVGTVKLGRMTAAARWISGTADYSASGAGPQDDQAALTGFSGLASPQFNTRMDNTLGFESAKFGGFSLRAYYGANEGKSNSAVATGAKLNDSSVSLLARYEIGPVDLRAAYELRNDKQTLNASTANDTKDKSLRFGLRLKASDSTSVSVAYDRMTLSDDSATGTARRELERNGWVVGARQAFGPHAVFGGFGKASDVKGVLANGGAFDGSNTGMKNYVIGYTYNFNKDFMFEGFVAQLKNEKRAKYDFDSGGISPGTGAKLFAVGGGLRYSF